MIAQILVVYGSFTTGTKTFFSGGQFRPDRGGQFGPDRGGQFGAVGGGQFKPDRGGQLHRIFHFDTIIEKHKIDDPALLKMAVIIRGADTDRFELAKQSAGLWAISAGLSYNHKNDREMLEIGMKVYDALYSWAKYVTEERHTWNPNLKVS